MENQLVLTAFIASFGLAPVQPTDQMGEKAVANNLNDGSEVQRNLHHFFDSLKVNDMKRIKTYRDLLQQETVKEQRAFEKAKEEVQSTREKNSYKQRNIYNRGQQIVHSKREASDDRKSAHASPRLPTTLSPNMLHGFPQQGEAFQSVRDRAMDERQEELVEKVFDAATRNDLEKVKQLIESGGVSPTVVRGFGSDRETISHIAAKLGNLDMLDYLLKRDPSVLEKDDYLLDAQPRTILETAVIYGHLNLVKYLVENYKEDIYKERTVTGFVSSPVTWAIVNNHLDIVKYFIEDRRMNVDTGRPEKADEENREYYDVIPLLFLAVAYRRPNITTYLIEERKANLTVLNENERNVLYVAMNNEDLNFIKHILDEKKVKIDVNGREKSGKTLVYVAVEDDHRDILQYLVEEKKADVNIPENEKHWTPLHQSIYSTFDVFKYLIDHGADIEKRDKDGATPLHLAAAEKFYSKKCKYLLEHGANATQKNNKGETPLDLAMANNNAKGSEVLVELSVDDVNRRNVNGETFVHTAAARNQIEFLDYLVSKKHADVDVARKRDGWTPLHCAASWDHLAICKYLIEHGANPHATDVRGKSPAQVASKDEVINYIQNASSVRIRRSAEYPICELPHCQKLNGPSTHERVLGGLDQAGVNYLTNDIQPFQFQNIHLFANFVARYFLSPDNNPSKGRERNVSRRK